MPQGLAGAHATFQRLMENTVGDMKMVEVLVYPDDIILFGRMLEEYEAQLEKVFQRLHTEGLKLVTTKMLVLPDLTYVSWASSFSRGYSY